MFETIIDQLDKDQSHWFIDWATGGELADFAYNAATRDVEYAQQRLKMHIAQRVFHRLLNAALVVGVVAKV